MTLLATPDLVHTVASGLDHPECVCLGSDGQLYAGSEGGRIYRLSPSGGAVTAWAETGGFLLGVAADGDGGIHVCDTTRQAVLRIAPDGVISERATGIPLPNFALFDAAGRCFVSDSGDYWSPTGTGTIRVIHADGHADVFHHGPFRFANGLALDPTERWLYVAESRAGRIVRVPADAPHGAVELVCQMPPERVPDGITCLSDGRLLVSCYTPDELWLVAPGEAPHCLIRDPTHELLVCPANTLIHDGRIWIANIGGWSIATMATELQPTRTHRPRGLHPGHRP